MLEFLDALHARARRWPPFARLAIITRILLAMAFIPTGMVKLLGERFTLMPVDTPVGFFFEAMYQSGFYWNFLGLGQVMAGILLLIPATATLGAVAFFPIILNITVVTWSVGFKGTIYITPLILLASIFLLCWDWDRLRWIIFTPAERPALPPKAPLPMVERIGYVVGGISGMVFFMTARGFVPRSTVKPALALGLLAVLMVLVGWFQAARRQAASE
jgi:uncharacterized membrane protein YphA (DoxX/SURF4 family)